MKKFNPNKDSRLKESVPWGTVRSGIINRINPMSQFDEEESKKKKKPKFILDKH